MKMSNYKDLLETCFSKKKINEIKKEALLEAVALRTMQQNMKNALDNYMKKQNWL